MFTRVCSFTKLFTDVSRRLGAMCPVATIFGVSNCCGTGVFRILVNIMVLVIYIVLSLLVLGKLGHGAGWVRCVW